MAISLNTVNTATDTWQILIDRLNASITTLNNDVVDKDGSGNVVLTGSITSDGANVAVLEFTTGTGESITLNSANSLVVNANTISANSATIPSVNLTNVTSNTTFAQNVNVGEVLTVTGNTSLANVSLNHASAVFINSPSLEAEYANVANFVAATSNVIGQISFTNTATFSSSVSIPTVSNLNIPGANATHKFLSSYANGTMYYTDVAYINHTHPISEVVNLQSSLDGKYNTSGGNIDGFVNVRVDSSETLRLTDAVAASGVAADPKTTFGYSTSLGGAFTRTGYIGFNAGDQDLNLVSDYGAVKAQGSEIWTTGNFDPNSKLNIANGTATVGYPNGETFEYTTATGRSYVSVNASTGNRSGVQLKNGIEWWRFETTEDSEALQIWHSDDNGANWTHNFTFQQDGNMYSNYYGWFNLAFVQSYNWNTGWVGIEGAFHVKGDAGGTSSTIYMYDDESPSGSKAIHANSNVIGFLGSDGAWKFHVYEDGNLYSPYFGWFSDAFLRTGGQNTMTGNFVTSGSMTASGNTVASSFVGGNTNSQLHLTSDGIGYGRMIVLDGVTTGYDAAIHFHAPGAVYWNIGAKASSHFTLNHGGRNTLGNDVFHFATDGNIWTSKYGWFSDFAGKEKSVRTWVMFTMNISHAIHNSLNISSIQDIGVGHNLCWFTSAYSNTAFTTTAGSASGAGNWCQPQFDTTGSYGALGRNTNSQYVSYIDINGAAWVDAYHACIQWVGN